ncbi:MAG: hypothetical protein KC766_14320 [Myxococcales bacterium]|nr:hypothetical protein [Myxococcales bacterium]
MKTFLRLGTLGLLGGLVVVACGGSEFSGGGGAGSGGTGASGGSAGSSAGAGGTSAGTGGSGGTTGGSAGTTGGSAGSAGTGASAGVGGATDGGMDAGLLDLSEFCSATADLYCDAAKPCCEQLFEFDQAACRSKYLTDCAAEVARVAATTTTYHPEFVQQCQDGLQTLLGICTPTASQFLENFDGLRACGLVFQGQNTQGESCSTDSECRPSMDPNVHMSCGGLFQVIGLGKCQRTTALPQGSNCEVGANAPNNEICRAGLYCDIRADVEVGKEPYQGTCQPAVEPDQACELLGGFDVQCGLGHYCKEGKCTLAQAGGEPCEQGKHEQCASGYCNLFAGNTCLDLVQMVSEKDCGASTTGAGAN